MQARLGHDFSGVRIHTDTKAAESAAELHAAAYTVGSHIAFGAGRYSPQTAAGRRLLVHELVHVIQQQGQRDHVSRLALGDPADAVEAEADAVAADVEARQAAPATGGMPGRQPYAPRVGAASAVRRAPDGQASAASMSSVARTLQLACVVRKGGCPQSRDAGIPEQSEIENYNRQCREEHPERGYNGPDIYPTDDECRNPPSEPLSTGEKILLAGLLVAGAAAGIAAIVVAGEVIIPAAITALSTAEGAAVTAWAFYAANAITINEIGLFAAGLVLSCDGDIAGLLRAIANDPVQGLQILAEVYILHVNIKVANGPARPATVPVKLLPPDEQTEPHNIRFRTVGAPVFEEGTESALAPNPPAPAGSAGRTSGGAGGEEVQEHGVTGGAAPSRGPAQRAFKLSGGPLNDVEKGKLAAVRRNFNLPVTPTPGDTTIVGILVLETGEELPIHSGRFGGPSGGAHRGGVPRGPGSGATRYNITHVESHAAAIMAERGVKRAILLIEKEPCASCAGYSKARPETDVMAPNLTKLLPKDGQLLIVDPDGTTYVRSAR